MKIVSLNTWGGRLFEGLLTQLPKFDADVVCLTEVFWAPKAPHLHFASFPNGDRFLPNLYRSLRASLKDYHSSFYPYSIDTIAGGHKSQFPLRKGIAIFVRKGLKVVAMRTGFVYGKRPTCHKLEYPSARNIQAVQIEQEDGSRMWVAHMHGVHTGSGLEGKEDTPARHEQAKRVRAFLERIATSDEKIVICGDFNVLPTSSLLKTLTDYGLRDLIQEHGIEDTRTSWYDKPGAPRFADYMLVSPSVVVQKNKFWVPTEPEISDHCPLILECH